MFISQRYHLLNAVLKSPGIYSCAIDTFLELCYYVFYPYLKNIHPDMTHFCHKIYDACVKYDQHLSSNVTDLSLIYDLIAYNVRDPIWTLIQSRCPSFRRRDCNAQFSEIFQESVFGSLNDSEKALFITSFQYNDCCECCGRIICGSMCSFVQYVSNYRSLPLAHFNDNWHMYLFAHNFFVTKIVCPLCGERTTVPNALTTPATVLFIEFSNEMQNQLKIQTIIEVGGLRYKLSGAVKNKNMHFTTCVTFQNSWMYIDDLSRQTEIFTTFSELLLKYPDGWFFFCYCLVDYATCDTNSLDSVTNFGGVVCNDHNYCKAALVDNSTPDENSFERHDMNHSESVVTYSAEHIITGHQNSNAKNSSPTSMASEFTDNAFNLIFKFHKKMNNLQLNQCKICYEVWCGITGNICGRCKRDKIEPRKFSSENNMVPSCVPQELYGLTQIEEMLIARAFPVMNVYCKPRGGQRAYKGHVILVLLLP